MVGNGERFFLREYLKFIHQKFFSASPQSKDLDLESNLETLESLNFDRKNFQSLGTKTDGPRFESRFAFPMSGLDWNHFL